MLVVFIDTNNIGIVRHQCHGSTIFRFRDISKEV